MAVATLWLTDFRCFEHVQLDLDVTGLTVLRGLNGAGKTSVLEAIGWLATQGSIRGAPREALVRRGAASAVVRAELALEGRVALMEAQIPDAGTPRMQVNRQPVRRRSQLADTLAVTVFSPEDLQLVQGGPAARRQYLDDVLVSRHARLEATCTAVERILRQRGALLRQSNGRLDEVTASTLDVWDDRLAEAGTDLAEARAALAEELGPHLSDAYGRLARPAEPVMLGYRRSWEGDLRTALAAARAEDLRRQHTSVGPHRDDLDIVIGGRPTRTHASQGEQRCIALALRLASHALRREELANPPVLLLDDVFSELDARRSEALVELLPPGQVLLTTAVEPPGAVPVGKVMDVVAGTVVAPA